MSDVIRLTLPMTPDRRLATNHARGRMQWTLGTWTKDERAKAMRLGCVPLGNGDIGRLPDVGESVRINVTIHWGKQLGKDGKMRQARRLDWDSATTICKPMIDGALVDTGILADDRQIVAGTVYQTVDPTGDGFTTIEITAVEAARKG